MTHGGRKCGYLALIKNRYISFRKVNFSLCTQTINYCCPSDILLVYFRHLVVKQLCEVWNNIVGNKCPFLFCLWEESLCSDRMTHTYKIITFSQLLLRAVNIHTYWWICLYRSQMWRTLALTCVLTVPLRPINLPCPINTHTGYTYSLPAKWYNSEFHWQIQGWGVCSSRSHLGPIFFIFM